MPPDSHTPKVDRLLNEMHAVPNADPPPPTTAEMAEGAAYQAYRHAAVRLLRAEAEVQEARKAYLEIGRAHV